MLSVLRLSVYDAILDKEPCTEVNNHTSELGYGLFLSGVQFSEKGEVSFFPSGIGAYKICKMPGATLRQIIEVKMEPKPKEVTCRALKILSSVYRKGTYHSINCNQNHFSSDFCFLLASTRPPAWICTTDTFSAVIQKKEEGLRLFEDLKQETERVETLTRELEEAKQRQIQLKTKIRRKNNDVQKVLRALERKNTSSDKSSEKDQKLLDLFNNELIGYVPPFIKTPASLSSSDLLGHTCDTKIIFENFLMTTLDSKKKQDLKKEMSTQIFNQVIGKNLSDEEQKVAKALLHKGSSKLSSSSLDEIERGIFSALSTIATQTQSIQGNNDLSLNNNHPNQSQTPCSNQTPNQSQQLNCNHYQKQNTNQAHSKTQGQKDITNHHQHKNTYQSRSQTQHHQFRNSSGAPQFLSLSTPGLNPNCNPNPSPNPNHNHNRNPNFNSNSNPNYQHNQNQSPTKSHIHPSQKKKKKKKVLCVDTTASFALQCWPQPNEPSDGDRGIMVKEDR
eukprot:TRINITY_DN4107_c0_g3_i1.p1 TRINITY_DN4107_c0_g3~~TRINITY_DN4107_c0_g3_i1.p1  ORF type:complete len:504 (+),score=92.93 TRINITY_DN4107_c0_g3_i1:169-1680(+)